MEAILASGWNFIMDTAPSQGFGRVANGWVKYGNSPVYIAWNADNLEGMEWLVAKAPTEYWKGSPGTPLKVASLP
jgi:hypothetical protein